MVSCKVRTKIRSSPELPVHTTLLTGQPSVSLASTFVNATDCRFRIPHWGRINRPILAVQISPKQNSMATICITFLLR